MQRTLSILKPDCIKQGCMGEVFSMIERADFRILSLKMIHLTKTQAELFYAVHRNRPFFSSLCEFMTSGPCVPLLLEKDNAVAGFRNLIGATDPSEAEEGTIRYKYASSVEKNIIHGSDSEENARIESAFFFSKLEIMASNI